MKMSSFCAVVALISLSAMRAGDSPKPPLKITPGKVVVPTDRMKRIWGELVHLDLKTRTGSFRAESSNEIMKFAVLPYAELLHHATFGDLQDFRVGERAIFRLHENEKGEWVWLTYIQDEMNFLFGHKEYYHVDKIDAERGRLECTDANSDLTYIRKKGILIDTDSQTRYWKLEKQATFAAVKVGDKLRTQTHGNGKGETRVAWEVFLDEASILKFQSEQKAVHAKRMRVEGLPAYVNLSADNELRITLFLEAREQTAKLKPGQKIRVAPAGIDRASSSAPVNGTISAVKGNDVTIVGAPSVAVFTPTGLSRLWIDAE